MKEFLDKKLCCFRSATIGDLFKLIVPVGWTIIAFCAVLAYLISPLSRGDNPRWDSACLVLFNALSTAGLSAAIFRFHRSTSYYSIEWTNEQIYQRKMSLFLFRFVAASFILLSMVILVYFAAFAENLNKCAHETCSADVSWCIITLIVNLTWLGISMMSAKSLDSQLDCAADTASSPTPVDEP